MIRSICKNIKLILPKQNKNAEWRIHFFIDVKAYVIVEASNNEGYDNEPDNFIEFIVAYHIEF